MFEANAFSVVIPLYDKRDYIRATLDSVLAQTHAPHEVIVVDDGSRDGGDVLVEAYGDARIRLVRQANAGPGAARNRGFAVAACDWVALIDADDRWQPEHLATLASLAEAFPQVDAVAAGWREMTSGTDTGFDMSPETRRWLIDFFREGHLGLFTASSIAIRRSAFLRTAGFGTSRAGEDSEFWIRFALDHAIAASDRQTALYVRGTGGIMERTQAEMARGGRLEDQPLFATLEAAIAAPERVAERDRIRAFADHIRMQHARSLLYTGRGAEARRLLAGMRRGSWRLAGYRLLARLPGGALRSAARLVSRCKRVLR